MRMQKGKTYNQKDIIDLLNGKIGELVDSIKMREEENSEIETDLISRLNSLKSTND